MIKELKQDRTTPIGIRYYADEQLLALVSQYHEVLPAQAQGILAGVLTKCLRCWFGATLTPTDRVPTYAQDFWLRGPERLVQLWLRFTDPHFDVIARLGERQASQPPQAITVEEKDEE